MDSNEKCVNPQLPFIWPDVRKFKEKSFYGDWQPFNALVKESTSAFGIISSLSGKGILLLKKWLNDNTNLMLKLIVTVYPTCFTTQDDLQNLKDFADEQKDRIELKIYPYARVTDRPTNAIVFNSKTGSIYIITGPSENIGFDKYSDGKINFAFPCNPGLFKSFQNYFNWLWVYSKNVLDNGVVEIPELIIPEGTIEATKKWEDYSNRILNNNDPFNDTEQLKADVDMETGEVTLKSPDNKDIPSPTEEIGFPRVDYLSERIARLYEKGTLVTIDKQTRIPPLNAPISPSLFGDSAETQYGSLSKKVSMKVSIIDDITLKEIDNKKKAVQHLLNKISFKLADGIRWIPYSAKDLFETELKRINEEGQGLISKLLKGNVADFLEEKKEKLIKDINDLYIDNGNLGTVPAKVVEEVVNSLKKRLTKAQTSNFIPMLSYTTISFNTTNNDYSSPWGQAFAMLKDIAVYPRKALTDPFFFRGINILQGDLINAMNVEDDAILKNQSIFIKDRCNNELALIKEITELSIESSEKCRFIYKIINGIDYNIIYEELKKKERQ